MARLSVENVRRATDANGDPLSGAKRYIYLAGTTTLATAYSDIGLTVVQNNPLSSDAGGLFSETYLLDGDYKVVIRTSADLTVDEYDNIRSDGFGQIASVFTFNTVAALKSDEVLSYTAGSGLFKVSADDYVEAEGFRYKVASSGASDHGITTTGGVKLYPQADTDGAFNVRAFGATGDGSTNDSDSFDAAATAAGSGGTVTVPTPDTAYMVGEVDWPGRVALVSPGYKRYYNPSAGSDLNGMPLIRKVTGAASCINFGGNSLVAGLMFDGVDQSCNGVSQSSSVSGMAFFGVAMYNFARGFGTANSLNGVRMYLCQAHGNSSGVYGLVDGFVHQLTANLNGTGVVMPAGANDTEFNQCRVEFNTAEGYRFFSGNSHNRIIGGIIDRNGEAGIRIAGDAMLSITGTTLRRNGSTLLGSNECAHIYIDGNASQQIQINGIQTNTGADDGGGGDSTPKYAVQIQGSTAPGTLTITGGDLSGVITDPLDFDQEPDNLKILGVGGVEDWVNTGKLRVKNGQHFHDRKSLGGIASGATSSTTTFNTGLELSTSARARVLTFLIEARNSSTGADWYGFMDIVFQREGGNASAALSDPHRESGANDVGTTGSDTVQVTLGAIAADASTMDFTVTNNHGSNTVQVTATLLPG